jgi:peptidyl-prolyl cis-trans isomerase B (cyclophilin B)
VAQGKKNDRESRERARVYRARQTVHEHRIARRRRDNVAASIAALVVVVLAVVAQVAFFSAGGDGVPEAQPSPSASEAADAESKVPSPELSENRTWTGQLVLNDVELQIELDGAAAPQAVAAFVQNTRDEYFPGKSCHRLTNDGFYVLQCASVDGTGAGDPNFAFGPIENAPADNVYPEGTLAMARASNNGDSNGRQFFIVYEDTMIPSDAAGGYTVFGRVTAGLEDLKSKVTSAGVVPGSAPNDGAPVVATTITGVSVE